MQTMAINKDTIRSIHKRQIARLLTHLDRSGQLNDTLERDIKRSFGYTFEDVEKAIEQGRDKETQNASEDLSN